MQAAAFYFMPSPKNLTRTMTKAAILFPALLLMFLSPTVVAQKSPAELASDEAARRQEATILLQKVLADAKEAEVKGDLTAAARSYEDAYALVQKVIVGIDQETTDTINGLVTVRLALAKQAIARERYEEANLHVSRALAADPKNELVLKTKKEVDKGLEYQKGRTASKETLAAVPEIQKQKQMVGTLVQDGKVLYEMGKLEEAEAKLKQATKIDPNNATAFYYLTMIEESRYAQGARRREIMAKNKHVEIEKAWLPPTQKDALPTPNPFATTNLVFTGPGRQAIQSKLHRIVMNEVLFDALPLPQVLQFLAEEAAKRDPDKQGINFMINPNVVATAAPAPQIDPATGNIIPGPAPEPLEELAGGRVGDDPDRVGGADAVAFPSPEKIPDGLGAVFPVEGEGASLGLGELFPEGEADKVGPGIGELDIGVADVVELAGSRPGIEQHGHEEPFLGGFAGFVEALDLLLPEEVGLQDLRVLAPAHHPRFNLLRPCDLGGENDRADQTGAQGRRYDRRHRFLPDHRRPGRIGRTRFR